MRCHTSTLCDSLRKKRSWVVAFHAAAHAMYWEGEYIPAGPPAKVPSDEELRVARAVDDMTNFIRDNELPKAREMLEKEPGLANGLTWTGATALMNVVCGNYRAGMELLFEFGADPTIQHKQFKRDGTSAFKNSSANARCYLSHTNEPASSAARTQPSATRNALARRRPSS